MITAAEVTRRFKAALRKQFPNCKFSVTRGGITWTDDGPTQAEVEEVIIATGLVEIRDAWDGQRYLRAPTDHGNIYFDRYNAAERAATEAERERQRAEWQEEAKHANAAVAAARRIKCEAIDALRHRPSAIDDSQLQAAYNAFDALRQRAEAVVAIEQERERRPSWAPPLTLEGELLELCHALGYLAPDAAPIARLWASYADPKRSRTVLRETVSTLPLSGIACRGFQLFAGSERGNVSQLLFEAQRMESGTWRFGPAVYGSGSFYPSSKWEQLVRERVTAEHRLAKYGETFASARDEIARLTQQIADLDAHDLTTAGERRMASEQRTRVLQLAQQRVLEFVGAPDAQMRLAARLWGHCCICGKELSDPQSLEKGIGPDCFGRRVDFIRAKAASESVEWLAFMTGMPTDFVIATIAEMKSTTRAGEALIEY